MWRRPNDSQPHVHGGPQDHVSSSSTSVLSLILPLKVQMPTLTFQWISMWTCEDTRRQSGNKSLLTNVRGSLGVLESVPAFTGWETEMHLLDRCALKIHSFDSLKMPLHYIYNSHGPIWTGNQFRFDRFVSHHRSDGFKIKRGGWPESKTVCLNGRLCPLHNHSQKVSWKVNLAC